MRVESKRLADESNVSHHSAASLFLLAGAEKQGRAFGTPLLRASILWAEAWSMRASTFMLLLLVLCDELITSIFCV
jgi:hypothetical protein